MNDPGTNAAPRPNWRQGAIWMGASTSALAGMWWRHGCRIAPRFWLDAAIDAAFSVVNSCLGRIETVVLPPPASAANVPNPVFIVGHWRTGTTFLHELFALDPRRRCPTTYECLLPNHFRLTERWLKPWTGFLLPELRWFDGIPVGWDRPQEDEFALLNLGIASPYSWIAFPRQRAKDTAYLDLETLSADEQSQWERAFQHLLRRLVAHRPGQLVLKSPTHTCRVPTLLRLFPDARFIYLVRHPRDVVPSTVRMWQALFTSQGYQHPPSAGLVDWVLDTFDHFHQRFEDTRERIPQRRLAVVRFEEFVAAPADTLRRVYDALELGDFAVAQDPVDAFCAARRDYQPRRHSVDDSLGRQIEDRCRPYAIRHGYLRSSLPPAHGG
jgi:hypothetical protein